MPTYEHYIDLSGYNAGDTFTVSRTGFFFCYIGMTSGVSSFNYRLRNRLGNDIFGTCQTLSGGGLVYLSADETYTVLVKAGASLVYLYY